SRNRWNRSSSRAAQPDFGGGGTGSGEELRAVMSFSLSESGGRLRPPAGRALVALAQRTLAAGRILTRTLNFEMRPHSGARYTVLSSAGSSYWVSAQYHHISRRAELKWSHCASTQLSPSQ